MATRRNNALWTGFLRMLYGAGHVPPPSPGGRDIAIGNPPVEAGDDWQWIQPFAYTDAGPRSPNRIGVVPPAYQDWPDFPVNATDPGGFLGGGPAQPAVIGTSGVPFSMAPQDNLYFNPNNNLYYDVPDFQVQIPDDGEAPPL